MPETIGNRSSKMHPCNTVWFVQGYSDSELDRGIKGNVDLDPERAVGNPGGEGCPRGGELARGWVAHCQFPGCALAIDGDTGIVAIGDDIAPRAVVVTHVEGEAGCALTRRKPGDRVARGVDQANQLATTPARGRGWECERGSGHLKHDINRVALDFNPIPPDADLGIGDGGPGEEIELPAVPRA